MTSDQGLHSLLTELSVKNRIKATKQTRNCIGQHVTVEESTNIQWVKVNSTISLHPFWMGSRLNGKNFLYLENVLSFRIAPRLKRFSSLWHQNVKLQSYPLCKNGANTWNTTVHHKPINWPVLEQWTCPSLSFGWVHFYFYFILHRNSCKQTMWTPIIHRFLLRLNWICSVCICPPNASPVIKGLEPGRAAIGRAPDS